MTAPRIINLTGKPLNVRHESGATAVLPAVLPAARLVPDRPDTSHIDSVPFPVILARRYRIEGLPTPEDDSETVYVVTQDVALAVPERHDILTALPPDGKGVSPGFVAWDNFDIVAMKEGS